MEEVVGSIPTRSTIFSSTCRSPAFQFGSICSKSLRALMMTAGKRLIEIGYEAAVCTSATWCLRFRSEAGMLLATSAPTWSLRSNTPGKLGPRF